MERIFLKRLQAARKAWLFEDSFARRLELRFVADDGRKSRTCTSRRHPQKLARRSSRFQHLLDAAECPRDRHPGILLRQNKRLGQSEPLLAGYGRWRRKDRFCGKARQNNACSVWERKLSCLLPISGFFQQRANCKV